MSIDKKFIKCLTLELNFAVTELYEVGFEATLEDNGKIDNAINIIEAVIWELEKIEFDGGE